MQMREHGGRASAAYTRAGPRPWKNTTYQTTIYILWIKIENKPSQEVEVMMPVDREVGALDFFLLSALRRRGEARW